MADTVTPILFLVAWVLWILIATAGLAWLSRARDMTPPDPHEEPRESAIHRLAARRRAKRDRDGPAGE